MSELLATRTELYFRLPFQTTWTTTGVSSRHAMVVMLYLILDVRSVLVEAVVKGRHQPSELFRVMRTSHPVALIASRDKSGLQPGLPIMIRTGFVGQILGKQNRGDGFPSQTTSSALLGMQSTHQRLSTPASPYRWT